MASKKDRWSYTAGTEPPRVTVFERTPGGTIHARAWKPKDHPDGDGGRYVVESLGHTDKEAAKDYADDQRKALRKGQPGLLKESLTVARLFHLYQKYRTPDKSEQEQEADVRRMEMWKRALGPTKDPAKISRSEWEEFIKQRSSGKIDSWGYPKDHDEYSGRPVGPRTVERDLKFLLATLNWAKDWRTEKGYLLSENPCRGYTVPQEKNPSRPVASDERVENIRKVAPQVTMRVWWGKKSEVVMSHLPCIFDLAVETGRRLSSIIGLRYADLLPEAAPHGSLRWRADTDKEGRESVVPITPEARNALDRHMARMREVGLPGIGDAPLFPAQKDPAEPIDRSRPDRWLRKAEKLADVTPHNGSLWHAYRRRWATVRKHLSPVDVAETGGWKGPETLQRAYQQADPDTMYEVVTSGGKLRKAGQ